MPGFYKFQKNSRFSRFFQNAGNPVSATLEENLKKYYFEKAQYTNN